MIPYRASLQFFALLLSYITALYFAASYGFVAQVWHTDFTHITSIIAGVFVLSVAFIGHATWQWDYTMLGSGHTFTENEANTNAYAATSLMRSMVHVLTLLGLAGTVVGLIALLQAMASIDLSNPQNIITFIAIIAKSQGTAMYCTICGITSAIALTFMTSNLEYFSDKKD